jgi:putative transposase
MIYYGKTLSSSGPKLTAVQQKLKCLTLIDDFTKESLRIHTAGRIECKRVVKILEEVIPQLGYPKVVRSDNGPEFMSAALLERIEDRRLCNLYKELVKLWQNGINESLMANLEMSV